MLKTILLIAVGGALGSVLRFLTGMLVGRYFHSAFPLATFVVNIVGCFLIGLIIGTLAKHELADSNLKLFLVTGFCGGYTTFSAFGFENISLLQNGSTPIAFAYICGSILVGFAAVWLGLLVSQ